jgi:hypothetical protein
MRSGDVGVLEVGNSLQEARRRRGVALSDAEAATMIRSRYLEALERERFDVLPAGPYARSFLIEYAEYLGLDGDILAAEYDLRFAPQEPPPEPPSTRRELADLVGDVPIRTPLLGFAVVVLVAIAVWELGGSRSGTVASPPPPQLAARTPLRPATRAPVKTAPAAVHPPLTLTAARGPCWLSVHLGSRSGKTLYEGTLQAGRSVRFGLRSPLWIRVGAPWNVDAAIGARSVNASLPSLTGDVVASRGGVQSAA